MKTRFAIFLAALFCLAALPAGAAGLDYGVFRSIPIQSGGRVKPLDTFARESVLAITGKESYEGREPLDLILSWLSDPRAARKAPLIDVSHNLVHDPLGLAPTVRHLSLEDLVNNQKFAELTRAATAKQQQGQALSNQDKQVMLVMQRMDLLNNLTTGEAFTMVPNATTQNGAWTSLLALAEPDQLHVPGRSGAQAVLEDFRNAIEAYHGNDNAKFTASSSKLKDDLKALGPISYPSDCSIQTELTYNDLHPFRKAWIIYLAAFLVLAAAGTLDRSRGGNGPAYWIGMAMVVGGLVLHAYGFYLRCTIAHRPPVTNMYESLIWVSFGAMIIAFVLECSYRTRTILMGACVAVVLCMMIADNTASVLDPAINPLTPVLRSDFWLTIHVLTITMSYAAFLVAMGEGHIALWNYAFHAEDGKRLRGLHQQIYRAIQVGVLLLAAGTILGGVWANYSWGRFWGWDTKEVWALIALLGYLAILHGRYAGWIHNFGLAVGSVVAFLGVLMAWYGVNFVLGAGLHSYGFGDGGQQYVGTAVVLDMIYVAIMVRLFRKRQAAMKGS